MERRPFILLGASALAGCTDTEYGAGTSPTTTAGTGTPTSTDTAMADGGTPLTLSSPAFDAGDPIPTRYTCDGEDVSPELNLAGVPEAARSLALVVDDPDAPGSDPFVHWLVWNLSPSTTTIPEGVPTTGTVAELDGARQGTNGFGEVGYRGPCPPTSHDTHTYLFRLRALDATLDLEAGAKRPALEDAISGHVVAETTLTGTYNRT